MMNQNHPPGTASRMDRKKKLVIQAAVFRSEALRSKNIVKTSLRPDSVAKSLFSQIKVTAIHAMKNKAGATHDASNLSVLLPLLASGFSAFYKRPLAKPIIATAFALSVVGTFASMIMKYKVQHTDRRD